MRNAEFRIPHSIAFDKIYVTDTDNGYKSSQTMVPL